MVEELYGASSPETVPYLNSVKTVGKFLWMFQVYNICVSMPIVLQAKSSGSGYKLHSSFRYHDGVMCGAITFSTTLLASDILVFSQQELICRTFISNSSIKFDCIVCPSSMKSPLMNLLDFLFQMIITIVWNHATSEIIVLGDFSLDNKDWIRSS